MASNPAFTEKNVQKPTLVSCILVRSNTLLSRSHSTELVRRVWPKHNRVVNTLTSTAPISSPIICTWAPANICEQWERNLPADVRGAGKRDEPLRTSAWDDTSGTKTTGSADCVGTHKIRRTRNSLTLGNMPKASSSRLTERARRIK